MVHPDHWRTGVGATLMNAILDLADNWLNLLRVDLGVLSNNPAAINLYGNIGFVREGARRKAIFGDGKLLDEIIMARLRDNAPPVEHGSRPQFSRRSDVSDISIRPLKIEDTEALHEIISDPAVARGLNQIPSLEVADVRKKTEAGGPGLYRYSAVAKHEDGSEKVVGNVTMHQPQNPRLAHSADLGISVHRDYWGTGIGQRLMATIVDLADNWLNLSRLELEVYTDNQAAIHLYKRFGFEIEGTRRLYSYGDGRWSDAHIMARLRANQTSPDRPVST
jgi:putative acetyltransferase